MAGKDAIIDRILDDAYRDAQSTIDEAKEQAQTVLSVAQNDARIFTEKHNALISSEVLELKKRRKTVSELEVKKLILKAKQDVLNDCFNTAVENVRALPKEKYLKLIEGMLKEASDGDTVTVSHLDKDIITKEFIDAYIKKRNINLTLDKKYGNFKGGIILSSKGLDKNLTLEVEIYALRNEMEPEINKLLFEGNK